MLSSLCLASASPFPVPFTTASLSSSLPDYIVQYEPTSWLSLGDQALLPLQKSPAQAAQYQLHGLQLHGTEGFHWCHDMHKTQSQMEWKILPLFSEKSLDTC